MKVITWETPYYEDHGATLKHKCGKRIVTLSLLSFSLIFLFWPFLFFYGLFFFIRSLIPTYGGIIISIILSSLGTMLYKMMITTLLFFLQLNNDNAILRTNMTLYECPRRCTVICNESEWHEWKNYEWWLCHKYDVNYMIMLRNMTMTECVMINGTVESCMTIYLGMAMEMP